MPNKKKQTPRRVSTPAAAPSKPRLPKRKPKRSTTRMPGMRADMDDDVHTAICGLSDPFCQHARDARVPDDANIRSLPFTANSKIAVTADAAGSAAQLFLPGFTYQTAVGTLVSDAVTYTTLSTVVSSTLSPASFRIVSWGLRIRSTTAPLSASGMVRIRGFTNTIGTNLTTTSLASYNADFAEDIPLQDCKVVTIIGRKIQDADARRFFRVGVVNSTANVSDWSSPGYAGVQVGLSGAASGATLDIEFIMHYELAFDDGDVIQQLSKPSRPDNVPLRQAVSHIAAAAPAVHTSKDDFEKVMKELAHKAAAKAGKSVIKKAMTGLESVVV